MGKLEFGSAAELLENAGIRAAARASVCCGWVCSRLKLPSPNFPGPLEFDA